MPIVTSETIADAHTQSDGRRNIIHYFTDHLGGTSKRGPKKVAGTDTEIEYVAERIALEPSILSQLATKEIQEALSKAEQSINPDKVPDHQTQAEFDRRVLGQAMLLNDVHIFYVIYPMFQAVESRGGANANQRAIYLGISIANYNLIAERFGNVNGVAWFLADEKAQIWPELPEEFN